MNCKMCSGHFPDSEDEIVMCSHQEGLVHLGCCVSNCSMDGKPCNHSQAIFSRIG